MSKQAAIQAILDASEREQAKPAAFLNAWKDGIHLAGIGYFNVTSDTVGQATDKFQLVPDLARVFDSVGVLSHYEQVFLISLCQFYCDSDTHAYCADTGLAMPSLADIANLDTQRLDVITRLMHSYSGW